MRKKIVIEGDVIPAGRPRFSRRRVYQPARSAQYREQIQWTARQAMKGAAPLEGALAAIVKLYRRYQPTAKKYGDVDNHLKALFDGLNEIVFVDDSQIVRCVVEKHMDKERPRAEITIQSAQV